MLAGLAVSNIAWPQTELPAAMSLARRLGLAGIELAPFNVFGRWDVEDRIVRELRVQLEGEGLVCPALQGILFNVPEAQLFASPESRQRMAQHLAGVARIAELLGARACVFGAPKQRDPGGLADDEAFAIARDFFASVGPVFADHGTTLAIEANARTYACRFLVTTAEAIDFVRSVDTPGIRLQIDTGTIFLEGEDPDVIKAAAPFAVHAHVSEPQLQPIGSADIDHAGTSRALRSSGYAGFLSIEMRATDEWTHLLERAAATLKRFYL